MKIKILLLIVVILISGCISEPQVTIEYDLHNPLVGSYTSPVSQINIEKINRSIVNDTDTLN